MLSRKIRLCNDFLRLFPYCRLALFSLVAEGTKNWKEYVKLCSKYIKKYGENDMYIYNWALRVEQNCDDAKVRKAAAKWMENRIKNLKKAEAKRPPLKEGEIRAMPLSTFSGSYEKLIKELK